MPRMALASPMQVITAMLSAGLALGAAQGQTQAPATGLILGRVVEATSGAPVRNAVVRFHNPDRERGGDESADRSPSVMTDSDGQFVFSGVPAGNYRVFATKLGYADGSFGQRRPNVYGDPAPLVMAAGERRGDVTIRVWKHAAITGTVVDEFGEPAVGVEVRAFQRVFIAGRPKLGHQGDSSARTDDRGIYRLSRLAAGEYVVAILRTEGAAPAPIAARIAQLSRAGEQDALMAIFTDLERANVGMPRMGDGSSRRIGSVIYGIGSPALASRGDRVFVYPSQYYGGTVQISTARPVPLRSGEEVAGIDFAIRPVPAFRVSGRVTDDNGGVANLPIRLSPQGSGDFEFDQHGPASTTLTDDAGRFTLLGVTPGAHVLRSLKGPGGMVGFAAVGSHAVSGGGAVISAGGDVFSSAPPTPREPTVYVNGTVSVSDADVDEVSLVVKNGVRISGRVEFVGARDQPDAAALKRTTIIVEAQDGSGSDWNFEKTGKIAADKQFETVELPPGSYFVRVPHPPAGWALESVMLAGRDLSDTAIDVTDKALTSIVIRFTDKPSQLTGVVRAAGDERVDEALVLVFPINRARWIDYGAQPRRLRQTGVPQNGTFSISGLPSGEYFVAAVRDDFLTQWNDPALLEKIAGLATRITVGPGEQKTMGLVMGRVR